MNDSFHPSLSLFTDTCKSMGFLMCRSVGSVTVRETAVTAATRRTVTEGHVTPWTSSHAIPECASQPGENIQIRNNDDDDCNYDEDDR